ncbi:YpeB-like protein with putative protease inhibitory function [Rathayibacter sp. PhB93]|uniref:PepSY domain-containing protein n=1 Tax=unclassified Rathayibacter TaxID=2609250 RepID=UPI000F49133B|nr:MULTISPECIES: PepSY domain-containing protein [unclassified Rathayibacter]ROQ15655.1 YpeB-like protein with putative protease inhibitory function [Rathayibacter sp. PhB93]TDQ15594.1 YpeB-like protein with putative protease inhibitory function [Rathayibacter sp. PhB1]
MKKKTGIIVGVAGAIVLVGAGTGIAFAATDGFERSDALTGADLDRASEVAIAEIGGGTVTSAERDDDGTPGYELELRGDDGLEYDVRLDDSFGVLVVDPDDDAVRGTGSTDDGTGDGTTGTSEDSTTGVTGAVDPDDLVGEELTRASEAAIAAIGGGTVTEAERSDDADHAFDVEVTRADGTDVDVDLDASYAVVRTEE